MAKRYVTRATATHVEVSWKVNRDGEEVVEFGSTWGVFDKEANDFVEGHDYCSRNEALEAVKDLNQIGG